MSLNLSLQAGDAAVGVAELRSALSERDAEILKLREQLRTLAPKDVKPVTQVSHMIQVAAMQQ